MQYPRTIFLLLLVFTCFVTIGQTSVSPVFGQYYSPKTFTIFYKLGESVLPIKVMQYGETKDMVYINLHADELTSVTATQSLLEKEGGLFIRIENNNKRNIRFRLRGQYYIFDPNRVFSHAGIVQTLDHLGPISEPAIQEVEKFAARILQLIPENPVFIIALHNNTDGRYGINSYLPGADRETDARQVYADPLQDSDDIFLTTDSILFHRLSSEKYNTVLQDNEKAHKDGSLSVYCGERNICYLNCETQHGKTEQYALMLMSATEHINQMNAFNTYQYILKPGQAFSFSTAGAAIYFGEKKIGSIRSVGSDTTQGLLDIDKKFKLYSNMEMFLIQKVEERPIIELRIDPTREKELLDPNMTTLLITAAK